MKRDKQEGKERSNATIKTGRQRNVWMPAPFQRATAGKPKKERKKKKKKSAHDSDLDPQAYSSSPSNRTGSK